MGSKGQCPACNYKFVMDTSHRCPPPVEDLGTAPTIKMEEPGKDFGFDLSDPPKRRLDTNAFLGTVLGFSLLALAVGLALWAHYIATQPSWSAGIRSMHPLFAYGGFTLVVTVFMAETLSQSNRFEHLRAAIPFLLLLTLLCLFLANVSGIFTESPVSAAFSGHWWLSLIATMLATAGLICSLTLAAHPDSDRHLFVVVISLAIGVLMITAYMGSDLAKSVWHSAEEPTTRFP